MKVIKKIDLREHCNLLMVAGTIRELMLMRKICKSQGHEMPEQIKDAMNAIMDVVSHKFQSVFRDEFPKYSENKMELGESSGIPMVKVFDEQYDNSDNVVTVVADDNSAGGINDMLDGIEGLESADDHVERLANDLRNKKGGQA